MAIEISNLDMYKAPETVRGAFAVMRMAEAIASLPGLDVVREGVSTPCWEAEPANVGGNYARLGNGAYVHVVIGVWFSPLTAIFGYETALRIASTETNGIARMDVHHLCSVPWCVNPDHLALLVQSVHQRIPTSPAGHGNTRRGAGERARVAIRRIRAAVQATLFDM